MRTVLVALSVLVVVGRAQAQHDHSPYAEHQAREIKALSSEELHGYLNGEGLGLALAAELNGYPGPKHVLSLAGELGLSAEQEERTREIFEAMRSNAVALGERLVEAERALDQNFAQRTIDPATLAELVMTIAQISGDLRRTHLAAHLEMTEVLTREQIARHNELRGYGHAM